MATFGYTTIGTAGTDNPGSACCWCKATSTPASNGTLTTISVYCQLTAGTPTINAAIYSDNAGLPGTLLAQGTPVSMPASYAWVDVTVSQALVSGTQYWFAVLIPSGGGGNDGLFKTDTNGGATEFYYKLSGPPGTGIFPADGSVRDGSVADERPSIYGTYTPSGGASPFSGSTFENPTRQRRSIDALSWSSNDLTIRLPVAPVSAPFFVTDWPNPRRRAPLNTSFTSSYAIDDSAPFAQTDWPNPVLAKRRTDGLSWQNELNTLLFTAPVTMPFRQLSWPNPMGKPFSVSLRGFTQASAFWMLKDTFYGAPGQPPVFMPPINPRGPVFPMSLRGATQDALTILPTPPVSTFNPAWAQGSNRTVGFGIEPE